MKTELKKKSTRTVHGQKVVRLRLDIPYDEVEEAEADDQDMLEWLDANVDSEVSFSIGPFEDEDQTALPESGDVRPDPPHDVEL